MAATPGPGVVGAAGREALDSRWAAVYRGAAGVLVEYPFHGGLDNASVSLSGYPPQRLDSTYNFASPTVRGWSAGAIWKVGESPCSNRYNRAYGATVGFLQAPFNVRIAHQRSYSLSDAGWMAPASDYISRNTLVAANLVLRQGTVYVGYGINHGYGRSPWDPVYPYGAMIMPAFSDRSRDLMAGIAVPVGGATFMLSYIRKDDRTTADRDTEQIAAGMAYTLSRSTSVYAAMAQVRSRSPAGQGRERSSAINIGLRHAF